MARNDRRSNAPLGGDDTVIDLSGPAALDEEATVLDRGAAARARHDALAAGTAAPAIDDDAPTLVTRAPTSDQRVTAPVPLEPAEATQPAAPPANARRRPAAGERPRPPAPQPMTFAERTGITKLITAAMGKSERRRRMVAVGSFAALLLLLIALAVLLPSASTRSRLTGWIDALPESMRPGPAANYPALPEPEPERVTEEAASATRRVRRPPGPANALDALGDAPRSRKLGADVDAASSRLLRGSPQVGVAQPMAARGATDTETLGIGDIGGASTRRDAGGEAVPLDGAGMGAAATGRVIALDGLDRPTARAVFQRAEVQFRYCYEAAIERNPAARGRVKLAVEVNRSGTVRVAMIEESQLGDPRADACMVRVAERLRFPSAANESRVSYLWIFVRGK